MNRIIKGDEVIVITGKNKGSRGVVVNVKGSRVLVENVNMVKKHSKPNPQLGVSGGIVEQESSIDISNVAIYNSSTKQADKIGFKQLDDGRKVRYFKSNDEVVDI